MKDDDKIAQAREFHTEKATFYQKIFIGSLRWGRELQTFFGKSDYLRPHLKILDAGCGTGIVTKILYQHAKEKQYQGLQFYAFDLTENMLKIFGSWIETEGASNIETQQADVLNISELPSHWRNFDLIVTSAMLEYLPKEKTKNALVNLRDLLKDEGTIIIIVTKRNLITRWFVGRWWKANLFTKPEIENAIQEAEFKRIAFKKFTFGWSSSVMAIEAKK